MSGESLHIPVLLEEAVDLLDVRPGGIYVDGTVGLGGHSNEILRRLEGSGRLIGLDRDADALVQAQERLSWSAGNLQLINEDFRRLPRLLPSLGIEAVDGLLLDLGVSSLQLDSAQRGFSFRLSGPLDMRMDRREGLTAAGLIESADKEELMRIFREYGEERSARRIAEEIVRVRRADPIRTTDQLATLVERVKGRRPGQRIHPATQVFQALRIAVNQELKGLGEFVSRAIRLLRPGGRLVVIAFHSLEDRIIKQTFMTEAGRRVSRLPLLADEEPLTENVKLLTRKPIVASESETAKNPRARSARLRAVERLSTSEEQTANQSKPKMTQTQYNNGNRSSRSVPFSLGRVRHSSRSGSWAFADHPNLWDRRSTEFNGRSS